MTGILFLCLALTASARDLAWELFDEGNWPACSAEAQRLLLSEPGNETARFLLAAASLRQNGSHPSIATFDDLAKHASSPDIRARASLELSRHHLLGGQAQAAWDHAAAAFIFTSDSTTFLQSLASMRHAYRHSGIEIRTNPAMEMQYFTCERLLRRAPESIVSPRPDSLGRRLGRAPGQLITGFYRYCIRPAIGNRCVLSPSCSEYFLQASRRHGLLGIPMLADRLVREPSEVASARHPVVQGNRTLYQDPVDDHDFWLTQP